MSLHTVANHMAAHGRGPDTQLVHMSDREVAGLQALAKAHGGSLTINPHTGLVEAGFLDRMMPTLLGAGLMYMTGGLGAGALTAGEIGMGVGALQTARTGSLKEGIQAGLGAYGGAGLASGFGAGAPSTAAPTNAPVTAPAPVPPATVAPPTTFTPDYALQAPAGAGAPTLTAGTGAPTLTAPADAASTFGSPSGMSNTARIEAAGNTGSYADRINAAGAAPTSGPSGIGSLTNKEALKYGAASLGSMVDTTPKPIPGVEEYNGPLSKYRMADDYQPYDVQQPNPYYAAQYKTYAVGGDVSQDPNMQQVPAFDPVVRMAGGGLPSLGGYSDGGRMLKGPGDGMSDSIPAQIGGKQPARLADGEFVVPADVVSHLGNGSTDAGSRQLYKMMDRIRQQRTGKKHQAPEVNPRKAMPA